MPKVCTNKIYRQGADGDEIRFSYDVNVNVDGEFTTTIPKEIVGKIIAAGLSLPLNRNRAPGFFHAETMKQLEDAIGRVIAEYFSRELISQKIVLIYQIQSAAAFSRNTLGEIVPNCSVGWTGLGHNDQYEWMGGTIDLNSTNIKPFGVSLYVVPKVKNTYIYKSGFTKEEFIRLDECDLGVEASENDINLRWLYGICSMGHISGERKEEMEYSPEIAKFFVDLTKAICVLAEKIKMFSTPESIKEIAKNNIKFLE